jgi:16S rRNA (cytidine1402-2'-O)-methyltransferase
MALYIVPTPIGNLQDITLRAVEVLRRVDLVIAEDTRYSLKLLNHLGLKKKLISHYQPKEEQQAEKIIPLLRAKDAALISNAGTPVISDPGLTLIRRALAAGIDIVPLPGATALIPALAASGLETNRFLFLGFPSRKQSELSRFLKNIATLPYTLIFYESPRRIAMFLKTAAQELGDRPVVIAKEISKKNEKFIRGNLVNVSQILADETLLGELVVLIAGAERKKEAAVAIKIESRQDIYDYFQKNHSISKNQLKKLLMKKE